MTAFDIVPTREAAYPLRRIMGAETAEQAMDAFLAEHGGAGVKRTGPDTALLLGEVPVEARPVETPEPVNLFAHKRGPDGGWYVGRERVSA